MTIRSFSGWLARFAFSIARLASARALASAAPPHRFRRN
jgi:hypothetical protein